MQEGNELIQKAPGAEKAALRKAYGVILLFFLAVWAVSSLRLLDGGNLILKRLKVIKKRVVVNMEKTRYFGIKTVKPVLKVKPAVRRRRTSAFFEDPADNTDPFFEAMRRVESGKRKKPIKILFYGTSSIGFDRPTSRIRAVLQKKFGDGGKGFMSATKGWRYHRHRDIVWKHSENWNGIAVTRHRRLKRKQAWYGLAGVLSENRGKAWISFKTVAPRDTFVPGTRFSEMSLFCQAYPDGGKLTVRVDKDVHIFDTHAEAPRDTVFKISVADTGHQVRITTDRKTSRIYGAAFDRKTGVIVDAMMMVGLYIHQFNYFDPAHFNRQIALRDPDLVIFQIGAKDASLSPPDSAFLGFRKNFQDILRMFRAGHPDLPCIVVSIKDLGKRYRNTITSRKSVEPMVALSRESALAENCAFFNLYKAMGGKGSIRRWWHTRPRLVAPDLGHITYHGAVKFGNLVADMVLQEYQDYVRHQDESGAAAESK
jgi:hypothetical protein